MKFYKYFVLGVVILLVMPAVGCSSGSLSLEEELEELRQTYSANEEVWAYCMNGSAISVEKEEASESTLEMKFLAPDRYYGKGSNNGVWEETIIIGDRVYSQSSDNSTWREIEVSPEVLKAQKSSLEDYIPSGKQTLELLDSLTDLEKLPDDKLDGVNCFHCRGRIDVDRKVDEEKAKIMAALDPSDPEYEEKLASQELMWEWQRKWNIEYELWISREDCFIRQQRYELQIPAMQSPTGEKIRDEQESTVLMHYYDINEPIKIDPPL